MFWKDGLSDDVTWVLATYWKVARVRLVELLIPVLLVVLGGVFMGFSFALLIPLSNAVAEGGFAFLEESRGFGWILSLAPDGWRGTAEGERWILLLILLLIVGGRFGFLASEYLRKIYVSARNEGYRAAVSAATFRQVLTFGRGYFQNRSLGELDTELRWAAGAPELLHRVEDTFQRAVGLLVKMGVMVALSLPLTLAFLVTFPPVMWIMRRIRIRLESIAHAGADVERETRRDALDLLATIALVKSVSREETVVQDHEEILQRARGVAVKQARVGALAWPLAEVAILGILLAVQGGVMILSQDFRPGDLGRFAAFLLLVQHSFTEMRTLTRFRVDLAEQFPRLEAVARLFRDEGKHRVPSGTRRFTRLREGIRVEGLSFAYTPESPVLQELHAEIRAGAMTAIVGETGSGKTTFVDLLARFSDCPPGNIWMDGTDIREFDLASLHHRMAVVSQETWLLNRSLRLNLTFGLDRAPSDRELLTVLDEVALGEFVANLPRGVDTEIGDRGVRLSGGQRQRLAIARALLRDPDILILDEATSALDSVVEETVLRAIEGRSRERTLIVVAHRLATLRGAHHLLVMDQGRIVESGGWHELLDRDGVFARLYQAQFGESRSPV
ncbi:MAG: ABC transporter ATP-binding protein [Gemmatimonadota bacterium]